MVLAHWATPIMMAPTPNELFESSVRSADVEIRWADAEDVVGLFISGEVWAAFDASTGAGYSGGPRSRPWSGAARE
jgi:hypothetical protein